MKLSLTTITALLATGVLAAPSPNQSPNTLATDIADSPMPDSALLDLEGNAAIPGPEPAVPDPSEKSAAIYLYICKNVNFFRCQNLRSNRRQCYNLKTGWNNQVSSLRPNRGTTCCIYDNYGCKGGSLCGIRQPGIDNLARYRWNDRASSYRCW